MLSRLKASRTNDSVRALVTEAACDMTIRITICRPAGLLPMRVNLPPVPSSLKLVFAVVSNRAESFTDVFHRQFIICPGTVQYVSHVIS